MKKVIFFIAVITVIFFGYKFVKIKAAKRKNIQKKELSAKVKRENLIISIKGEGEVKPFVRVEINPPVNGRIDEVYVNEGDSLNAGDIIAKMSSDDRVVLLDAARAMLEKARKSKNLTMLNNAKKHMTVAENAYQPIFMAAPVSGTVIKRDAEAGQNTRTGKALFVISDKLIINAEIDESDIGNVKVGQKTAIVLDAFPKNEFYGKVYRIAHESKNISDVVIYDVVIIPDKVPSSWAAGMSANVDIIMKQKRNVLTIPTSFIFEENKKNYVLLKNGNNYIRKKIVTGDSDGKKTEVKKGLTIGDTIIFKSSAPAEKPERKKRMRVRIR